MPASAARSTEAAALADQLERAFRGGAWHGPAVLEALDGVDATVAAHRPVGRAHTIWEIVLHLTAWIEVARRRIEGEAIGAVPDELDWPAPEASAETSWSEAVGRLDQAHARLHAAALALEDERLDGPVAGSDPTVRGQLLGLLQHNVYHAGQIVLLARAVESSGATP